MSNEFGLPPVKQLLWGTYHKKPAAQMDFDRLIIKACQQISASDDTADHDFRPRIKDLNSGTYFLIDTGAAQSVLPRYMVKEELKLDTDRGLQAVNGTKIPTFGKKTVKVRFNKKVFEHDMSVATVNTGIIGWDFLAKFRFDLLWTNGNCVLYCSHLNRLTL